MLQGHVGVTRGHAPSTCLWAAYSACDRFPSSEGCLGRPTAVSSLSAAAWHSATRSLKPLDAASAAFTPLNASSMANGEPSAHACREADNHSRTRIAMCSVLGELGNAGLQSSEKKGHGRFARRDLLRSKQNILFLNDY